MKSFYTVDQERQLKSKSTTEKTLIHKKVTLGYFDPCYLSLQISKGSRIIRLKQLVI